MKVTHTGTIIELEHHERDLLKKALLITEEMTNDMVRQKALMGVGIRACLDTPREAGELRTFAENLGELL